LSSCDTFFPIAFLLSSELFYSTASFSTVVLCARCIFAINILFPHNRESLIQDGTSPIFQRGHYGHKPRSSSRRPPRSWTIASPNNRQNLRSSPPRTGKDSLVLTPRRFRSPKPYLDICGGRQKERPSRARPSYSRSQEGRPSRNNDGKYGGIRRVVLCLREARCAHHIGEIWIQRARIPLRALIVRKQRSGYGSRI
jgi:hypothetical protein